MKSIFMIALALAFSACSVSAYAQTPSTSKAAPKSGATAAPKSGATRTKNDWDCYGNPAAMSGKPCH